MNPNVAEHIRRIVAQAPPLGEYQRAKIISLLLPPRQGERK